MKNEDLLETARKRYALAMEAEQKNRDHALHCLKFRNLEQWNEEVKNQRLTDPEGARPCPVVDKTNQYLNQVINDYRQNRPAIKVRPVDDKSDPEVAKVFNGIIRHIEDQSGADLAYDTAYEAAVDGGFGYFRILTEYCDPMSFDQDIRIKRIRNRFTVLLDPDRQEPDGSDAKWGLIIEKMTREDFKREHSDADQMDFDTDGKIFGDWVEQDYVVVAEYFYIEKRKATICLYADGSVYEVGKTPAGYAIPKAIGPDGKPMERTTTLPQVKWKKITAKEVLAERDWPGKYIPIVEVVGNELDIEGKSVKYGLMRGAIEPQKMHNYAAAAYHEFVGMAPRSSWVAAEGQIEGYEELYRTANRRAISVLPYKPVVLEGGVQVPPPQRVAPPGIAPGWVQLLQTSEHDIQASMGMYANTTLGQGDAQSGKQELLQQRRGDTATFHYSDNSRRSISFAGRILIDLIPKVIDTQRIVRILGEDGTTEQAMLDPNQAEAVREVRDEAGAIKKIYNLNVGTYDVVATAGPGFLTKRMEAAEFLSQAATGAKDPATSQVLTYLAIKNNDWAGADEATKMLKKLLPPQVAEPEAGEEGAGEPVVQTPNGPVPATQATEIIGQLMEQVAQADEALKKAGDLVKIEARVRDEAAQLDTQESEIDRKHEQVKAAERELALREQLAKERLENERLRNEKALQAMVQPQPHEARM